LKKEWDIVNINQNGKHQGVNKVIFF